MARMLAFLFLSKTTGIGIGQGVDIHSGGKSNNFPLPLAPISVSPGVNEPNYNYIMDILLISVPHIIKQSCESTDLTR